MEVIANTYYYDETITRGEYKNKEQRKQLVSFKLRVPEELHEQFKEVFSQELNFMKRPNQKNSDNVDEYDFDVIPYDNRFGDVIWFHSNIICRLEQKQEVFDKIKDIGFTPKKGGGKSGLTYSVNCYPKSERGTWTTKTERTPKYPVCVVSYQRANQYGRTHKTLNEMKVKHYIFCGEEEKEDYENWFNPEFCELVILPKGIQGTKMGSTPARNFILDWGLEKGFDRVWMLDDNIKEYKRLFEAKKNSIKSSFVFTHVEDYVELYDNVGAVSHNFNPDITENNHRTCIVKNGKCYSSMLLKTDPEIRFRYKHQEDNLISMEYIHRGYTNLCFNSVLYDKNTSGQDGGGNKKSVYQCEEGKTDGKGYDERFEYLSLIVKILEMEGKLELIEGKTTEDFVKRSETHKSHEFHAKIHYEYIKNHSINKITKKVNYDELKSKQDRDVEFIFTNHPPPVKKKK